jgi:hypothetical protein
MILYLPFFSLHNCTYMLCNNPQYYQAGVVVVLQTPQWKGPSSNVYMSEGSHGFPQFVQENIGCWASTLKSATVTTSSLILVCTPFMISFHLSLCYVTSSVETVSLNNY